MIKRYALSEGMLLGYPPIDDEHRALVEMVNDLAALPADADRERVTALLDRFIDAFERHCREEVRVLRRLGYPKTNAHDHDHDDLIERVRNLRDRGGRPDELSAEALWIVLEEAIREDMQAKSFLQYHGVAD